MSLTEPVEGMPKKRRKLNKEMEAEMAAAKRKIELVGALINDIRDEDIQGEYLGAFTQIRSAVVNLIAKSQRTASAKRPRACWRSTRV